MVQRILLQTTIPFTRDDWHVGRFSLVAQVLRAAGHDVIARDRATHAGSDDPVLACLSRLQFDQLWLIAVDTGDGLTPAERSAITEFRKAGGGVLITRDHMDLGSSVALLAQIGDVHNFHSTHQLSEANRVADDAFTLGISWPNFHSGSNGGVQHVEAAAPVHPVMRRPDGSTLDTLPSHPHEGAVSAPPSQPHARVVVTGTSKVSGKRFNIAVAIDAPDGAGRAWGESTFHHFADYNWDPHLGSPSFVSEPPSDEVRRDPSLLSDTHTYVRNIARWLGQNGVPDATLPGSGLERTSSLEEVKV